MARLRPLRVSADRPGWKSEPHYRTNAGFALSENIAPVVADDSPNYRQPETGTAAVGSARIIGPIEALEDMR
jgi:hypothetical protein